MQDLGSVICSTLKEVEKKIAELKKDRKDGKVDNLNYAIRFYGLSNQVVALGRYAEKSGLANGALISITEQYEALSEGMMRAFLTLARIRNEEADKS
jgi:hypothetical protein